MEGVSVTFQHAQHFFFISVVFVGVNFYDATRWAVLLLAVSSDNCIAGSRGTCQHSTATAPTDLPIWKRMG